jgi:peptidyl-prolyl cis-trans isomerase D
MFGTIRKHQTWLWAVIITLTIISFVIFFSPYSRMNSSQRRSGNFGSINGQRITEQQYVDAWHEVDLNTFLLSGGSRWHHDQKKDAQSDPDRDVYQWMLLVQKQEQLGIHVGDDAAAQMAQQMIRSFEKAGISSPAQFVSRILQPNGLQMDDFERYVRHFVGIQELINTFGLSGKLVTPQEAKALYEREHQEMATEAVIFAASNYLAGVQATPEAISQFYSNRVSTYAIPQRVQVSYVRFPLTNFLQQAETEIGTNLSEVVEANYQRLGSNYFADAKSPEEAKAKIRQQLLEHEAVGLARKQALDFATVLFDLKPVRPENLQQLAQTNGLTAIFSEPFDREDGPKDMQVGPDFIKAAFALTADDPFGGPIVGRDGVYIIALEKQLPREIPTLDQIQARVVADYTHGQAAAAARQAGMAFYQTATNGLAQGKSFTNICAEANIKPINLPPFSISSRAVPEAEEFVTLNQLKQAAFSTEAGKISSFQPSGEGGMLLFVKAKLPLDQAKMQTELPNFVSNLRRSRQQEAFDNWLRRESEIGLIDTPIARPKPPPAMGSGAAKS